MTTYQLEGEMYHYVLKYIIENHNVNPNTAGITSSAGIDSDTIPKKFILRYLNRRVIPDVFGMDHDKTIYFCEGKVDPGGTSLDQAIAQGMTYQRFSHFVYLFFPRIYFEQNPGLRDIIIANLEEHGLGLLLVKGDGDVEKVLPAKLSKYLKSSNDLLLKETINGIINASYQLDNLEDEDPLVESTDFLGARAFMVRDICKWVQDKDQQRANLTEIKDLHFSDWLSTKLNDTSKESEYWGAAYPGGARKDWPWKRPLWSASAGVALGLLRELGKDSIKLTQLGEALLSNSTQYAQPELSPAERAFFYALAVKNEKISNLMRLLKISGGQIHMYKNACGHEDGVEMKGEKFLCIKEDCEYQEQEYDGLSLQTRYYLEYGEWPGYWRLSFWLYSEIFCIINRSAIFSWRNS
jgi:hypothetical protein